MALPEVLDDAVKTGHVAPRTGTNLHETDGVWAGVLEGTKVAVRPNSDLLNIWRPVV